MHEPEPGAKEGLAYANLLTPPMASTSLKRPSLLLITSPALAAENSPGASLLLPETAVPDVWVKEE